MNRPQDTGTKRKRVHGARGVSKDGRCSTPVAVRRAALETTMPEAVDAGSTRQAATVQTGTACEDREAGRLPTALESRVLQGSLFTMKIGHFSVAQSYESLAVRTFPYLSKHSGIPDMHDRGIMH